MLGVSTLSALAIKLSRREQSIKGRRIAPGFLGMALESRAAGQWDLLESSRLLLLPLAEVSLPVQSQLAKRFELAG